MLILTTNSPADWPAITQAIGSVLAILVTALLFYADKHYERVIERQRQQSTVAHLVEVLIVELDFSTASAIKMIEFINSHGGNFLPLQGFAPLADHLGLTLEARRRDFDLLPPRVSVELYRILGGCRSFNDAIERVHEVYKGRTAIAVHEFTALKLHAEHVSSRTKTAIEALQAVTGDLRHS